MAKINAIGNATGELTIDPGASGDSFVQFDINGTGEFRIGVDDPDDSFRISNGSALGTTDVVIATTAGEVTKPLTPAVQVNTIEWNASATGDGTVHTVVWGTEVFDQNSDFASSTFTAPVTGKYHIAANVTCWVLTASNTDFYIEITTSNRSYRSLSCNPGAIRETSSTQCNPGYIGVLCDMDASDTAVIKVMVSGSTKTIGVGYSWTTNVASNFCATLVC